MLECWWRPESLLTWAVLESRVLVQRAPYSLGGRKQKMSTLSNIALKVRNLWYWCGGWQEHAETYRLICEETNPASNELTAHISATDKTLSR